ncbi:zinc finger, CCHC-type containing protein, partial [Tanacetum coccineum]
MPYSTYTKLTDESPTETDIRLSLASHSYIYPLRIIEDVLVEVVEHVYPMDFMILDIKEDKKRPFILGTPFLTTAKAEERIKLHLERDMKFNQWRSKNFKSKHPDPVKVETGMDDEGEVTYGRVTS